MKKFRELRRDRGFVIRSRALKKLWKMTRLTTLLILLGMGQAFALGSYAQSTTLNLNFKNANLEEVLAEIENQSEFFFLYNKDLIDVEQKVDVEMRNKKINEILDQLFEGKEIRYFLIDRQIVLSNQYGETGITGQENITVQQQPAVSGTVTDESGQPLPGVTVVVKGTTRGTVTNADGDYTITNIPEDATLQFSFVGMRTQEMEVNNQTTIDVTMEVDAIGLEEVVAVGYGIQKKATLTGSVAAVKGEDIVTTKNENVQNMLTGKIAGVRVTQTTSEPGSFDSRFDIRGMGTPLVIIDGIPRSISDFQRLDPNDIDNMSVLKDASAAIYGVRSANGVVLVTTKRGSANKTEMNYSGSFTWQIPSGLPSTVDAIQYMTLRNEQAMHNVNGGSRVFGDDQFEAYRTGEKQSTDWYPLVFSDYAPQTVHNLNATGGNEKTTYYASIGYQYQEGFFNSSDLSYTKYNVRSNVTSKLSDRLTLKLNLSFINDEQNRPYVDSWWIIRSFWRQGPQIPAYANGDKTKPFHGLIEGDNPISFMDADISGSRKYNKKWIQPSGSLEYDIPGVEGLSLKGLFSYDYYVENNNEYQRKYNQYRYDEASETFSTFTRQSPNRINRSVVFDEQILAQASLNYDETFDMHKVAGTVIWEAQKRQGDNFAARRDLVLQLPYLFAGSADGQIGTMDPNALYEDSNMGLAGRFNYAFDEKYLAEFLFRYDGSSRFGTGSQWGFFPAASLGWRVSEENFFESITALSFVEQLKIRASYGKTGDDRASSYQFISGYNYPTNARGRNFVGGYVFDGSFVASADNKGIPNPNITWYTSTTFDIGVDFEGWNGLLGFSGDYFSRKREGLLDRRTGGIPTVVGASLPQENLNSDRTYGFDLELNHRNRINRDFYYNMKGLFSIARVKRLYVERAPLGSSWDNWKSNQNDRLQGAHWGLQGDGQFQSWEEIYSSPYYIGRGTIIGDYKYEDWNGDGEINGNDDHPTRYNQYPWMNFSYIFNATYKSFDINFLLQGSAMSSLIYGEQLRIPLWGSGESGAMVQFMDRWHPVDPKVDPYDPSIEWVEGRFAYTGTLPPATSTFNTENSAYLRLKSVELGYTLSSKWVNKIGIKNFRIYTNAYNLFTITKVDYVDPEHPDSTYGYLYPLNKTVSVGLNVKF